MSTLAVLNCVNKRTSVIGVNLAKTLLKPRFLPKAGNALDWAAAASQEAAVLP